MSFHFLNKRSQSIAWFTISCAMLLNSSLSNTEFDKSSSEFSNYLFKNVPSLGIDFCPVTALDSLSYGGTLVKEPVISPNQRFSIELTNKNRDYFFSITDHKTGNVVNLPNQYLPVFSFHWSPDSRTVLSIEHAAQTSLIEVIHWNDHEWKQFLVDPPMTKGDDYNFHVVDWKFFGKVLLVKYIVNDKDGNRSLELYKATFEVNVSNGSVSHVTKTPLSVSEYVHLRTPQN